MKVFIAAGGVALLLFAGTASSATQTIQLGSLVVASGTVNGTATGFQPNATVTVNGRPYVADATGTINLNSAPVDSSGEVTISFVDATGAAHTATVPLQDALTGLPLSLGQLLGELPSLTAPRTITFDTGGSTGGGSTTGTGGSNAPGASSGAAPARGSNMPAGAVTLADGSTSIPATSVRLPYRLVISGVQFTPRIVRSARQLVTARFQVRDTRGLLVRGANVWMRDLPLHHLSAVKAARTSMTGWVVFKVRTTTRLKLQKGGRVNIFVRAWTPGQSTIGGTSTRRLVSLRATSPR